MDNRFPPSVTHARYVGERTWRGMKFGDVYEIVYRDTSSSTVGLKTKEYPEGCWCASEHVDPAAAPPSPEDKALTWLKECLVGGYENIENDEHNQGHKAAVEAMLEEVYGLRAVEVPATVTFVPV